MTGKQTIPFVDLRAQHEEVRGEIEEAVSTLLTTSAFVGGAAVEGFESAFADYLGVAHVVGVSNGTDAVRIALQAIGAQTGDAILTVAHTFIGTTEGASQLGILPLFVDVDARSATMSPAALGCFLETACVREQRGALRHRASGRRIAAVVPVHLYGQSADMAPLLELARRHGVALVEDAAQAQGATYRFPDGRVAKCGSMGDAAAFSFYPGKNLGAIGEAGAVVVRTSEQVRLARMLRDHGQTEKYIHRIPDGGNMRLDAIQASVLSIKLARLDAWNDARRQAAARYDQLLAGHVSTPAEMPWARHIYHLYVVQIPERDRVRQELAGQGVATGLHYPIPLHRQPAFEGTLSAKADLPETERLAATCLSLPMHPHIEPGQVDRTAEALLESTRSAAVHA